MRAEPASLARVRHAIDRIDDVLLLLLAGRIRLVRRAGYCKRSAGLPLRDPAREARMHARAATFAGRIGLPVTTARRAIALAIDDACREQGLAPDLGQGCNATDAGIIAPAMSTPHADAPFITSLLRWLPPPARFAPWLRLLRPALQHRLLERVMAHVLAAPIADGALDFMQDRRLGIDVSDLDLHWVIELHGSRLIVGNAQPDACVRGSVTDLLLLASRLEDADTLFFQRRLVVTGDTELSLTARNLLDRLPWEAVPLGLRIVINRSARLARDARAAHRGET